MPYLFGIRLDCYMVNWFENVCNKKKKIKEPNEREMRQKGRRDRRKEEKGDKKREATTYVPMRLMQCLH